MTAPQHSVEDALHAVEDRAAMLRYFAESLGDVNDAPEPAVFAGLGDLLRDIEETIRAVRRSLDVKALGTAIGGRS